MGNETEKPRYEPSREELNLLLEFVRAEAKKAIRKHPGMDFDELIGEGNLALVRRIEDYDPTRGATLWTYCRVRIPRAMTDHLRREFTRVNRGRQVEVSEADGEIPLIEEENHAPGIDLRDALDRIEDDRERFVVARKLSGFSDIHIAGEIDRSERTVRRIYQSAIVKIRPKTCSVTDIQLKSGNIS